MDLCPHYVKPVIEYESKLKRELYHPAVKLYEEKKYEESFRMLLRYINEEATEKHCPLLV